MTYSALRRATAATLAFFSASAFAQTPPSLVIVFDSANASVPVGGVATAAIGLLLAFTALWALRKRDSAARSLLGLMAAVLVAAGAFMATESDAGSPTSANLVTSPTNFVLTDGAGTYSFTNATSGLITIRSVTLLNGGSTYVINNIGTTCVPSLSLAQSATCQVVVIFAEA